MWKCLPFYLKKILDADIDSKGPQEDLKVF